MGHKSQSKCGTPSIRGRLVLDPGVLVAEQRDADGFVHPSYCSRLSRARNLLLDVTSNSNRTP